MVKAELLEIPSSNGHTLGGNAWIEQLAHRHEGFMAGVAHSREVVAHG